MGLTLHLPAVRPGATPDSAREWCERSIFFFNDSASIYLSSTFPPVFDKAKPLYTSSETPITFASNRQQHQSSITLAQAKHFDRLYSPFAVNHMLRGKGWHIHHPQRPYPSRNPNYAQPTISRCDHDYFCVSKTHNRPCPMQFATDFRRRSAGLCSLLKSCTYTLR